MDKNLSRSGLKTPSTQQQHAHKMHLMARHLFHHLVLHLFLLLLLLILLFTHFSIWSKIHSSPQHVDSFQQVVQASKLTSFPKPLYNISTWVGGGSNFNFAINSYGDSTNRVDAMYSCLQYPKSLSLNSNHSILYVAATYDHMIRKISKHPSNPNMNLISTVAGVGVDGFSDNSFLAKNAKLSRPTHAIEHPVNSDVIISDSGNHCIRKVSAQTGIISILAGNCTVSGYDGDSGLALNAKFNNSMYLAITKNGSWLYVADTFNGRVRRVNIPEGTIETIAGNPTGQNGDCPVAIDCLLDQPQGLALSSDETLLYIAESASNRIRILSLTTSPMSLTSLQLGGGVLNFPTQIALHENQQALYILDHNAKQVKKVSPLGASSVLQLVYGSEYFEQPGGLAVNSDLGHVYVSDVSSNLVKLFSNGDPKIVAGKCQRTEFIGDNVNGTEVELVRPSALAFDSISGELYIADTDNHVIRKLQNNGIIVTLAGNTQPGNFNTTMVVMANSTRLDAVAYMYPSVDVQTGKVSSLYMSDSGQSVIMKWNLMDGTIVGVAGTKLISADSGDGGLAIHALVSPKSLLVVNSNFSTNASAQQQAMKNQVRHGMIHTELALENTIYKNTIGEVYFVNSYSNTIRKILTNGTIVRVAGLAQQNVILNAGDGGLALEATMSPQAITFDLEGNLLVSSRGMIRKIFIHNGTIVGVAGQNGNYGFSGDEGLALNAQFSSNIPSLYMSPQGDLFISDLGNYRIRKISGRSGIVTTVAGNGSSSFSSIGEYEPSNALTRYVGPLSIIGGDNNSLYLVENNAKRVRKLIQYCQEGWTGSDCSILQLKKLRAYFETSMAFTGLTISLMIKIEDEDFKHYAPETITYSVSLFKEPMIQKSDLVVSSNFSLKDSFQYKFESNGNYSAEVKVMFERNVLGSVKSLNKLQVLNYEELMSENSMKNIPVKEVASLALNPEMYSNASTMVNTLSVLTRVLTSSSVRNSSDLSETLTVVNALGAISSNREEFLPTTLMSSISSFLSNVSSEIVVISQGMTSDSSNGQLSTVESTAKNILTAFSNCFSFQNFTPSPLETNSVLENLMIVGSTTSTRFEHLLQLTSTAFQIHVKRNLLNDPSQNHETASEPLQIPNQGGRISTPFELRNLNSNNVSVAVMSFGNLEKVKNLYSWNRDVTTQLINSTQFENLQQVVDALSNSSTVQRVNLVIPFELKYLQNWAILPVRELTNPVTMEIRIPKQAHELMTQIIESSSNYRIVCMYWNETKLSWESNGCLTELLNTSTVTCQCNHTTTFTAFVEVNNLLNQVDLAITIAQIIVSSLLIIVISAFLLLFILTSQKNPMKSRWILPFFALASLIVELIFSFIVPNAISLSGSDRSVLSAGNIVKQVSAMISVTFFALALLNYVVLVVRYLLFRYMYEIMELFAKLVHDKEVIMNRNVSSSNMNFDPSQDFENNQPKWFWLLKRMASKGVQIVVNIVLAIIIIGYFVIFISLVGTSSIASTSYTKVMAGSLLGYVLVISLIVIIVFVLDAVFESRFTQMTDETKLTLSKKNSEMDFKTQESQKQLIESFLNGIKNYFTTNDALSFRAEFIYYMTGVACFVISYSLGLWFIDQPTRNGRAEQGVQLAFDVLSVLFFIAAFGGHVSIVTAVNYMKSKRMKGYRNVETSADSEDDMSEELREILTQPSLCKIFEQYAKLEFSLENIIFWKKLDRMKQLLNQSFNNQLDSTNSKTISSWELLEKEFSQWKVDHMDANASMEINFPSHIKHKFNAIHTQLQKQEPSALPSQQLIQELFQDMHSDLILNLSDTFSRFMFTESYEKIMTFMQLKKEMNASFDDTQQNNSSKSIL